MDKPPFSDADLKQALRQQLASELKTQLEAQEKRPRRRLLIPASIAASFLILISAGLWFYRDAPMEPTQVFEAFFEPYPNELYPIDLGQADQRLPEERALQLYELEDYAEAERAFRELPDSLARLDIRFYEAQTALAQGHGAAAATILEGLQQNPDTRYQAQAGWYLALAQVQQGNTSKALAVLEELLENPNHPYFQEARRLQTELAPE